MTRRDFAQASLAVLGSLALQPARAQAAADSLEPIPPDLPLPSSGPSRTKWIREAIVLQPWADTQFTALTNAVERARGMKQEFGFNAIIVLPTDAHNALCDFVEKPNSHLTDAQFREGVEAYRKEGYRLILYTSVMHCGHAPVWQSGELNRAHPDWSQRDPQGTPITSFGNASWLCGSSPARDYTLDYTLRLQHDYSPDGFMLDNNGFGHTKFGWTCYCDYCQQGFRKYALARCGADWVKSQTQIDPQDLKIPTEPGRLFALWTHWRNRVWAEIDELFQKRLRKVNPQILFFANTQYDLPVDTQASSLQFQHEDIVFSETHEVDPWYISQKMVLGQALAGGRPLWDYMGTFASTPQNPALDSLRPIEVLQRSIPASLAHGARPWIVYLGFNDAPSEPALREMGRYMGWYASHPGLYAGTPNTPVATVVSLRTRDVLARLGKCRSQGVTGCDAEPSTEHPLTPPHLERLLKAGVPVVGLVEARFAMDTLRPFQVVTLESGMVMNEQEAKALSAWVSAGGFLITVPEAGEYDDLGCKREKSLLLTTMGLSPQVPEAQSYGKGKVLVADAGRFADAVLDALQSAQIPFGLPQGMEVICYRSSHHHLIHLLRNDAAADEGALRFPHWLAARPVPAKWFSPDWPGGKALALEHDGGSIVLRFPEPPPYSVLVFSH